MNSPRPVTVSLDRKQLPVTITEGKNSHEVMRILEVWRVDDEWWRKPLSRRYIEVVLENGNRSILFENMASGEWFVQA